MRNLRLSATYNIQGIPYTVKAKGAGGVLILVSPEGKTLETKYDKASGGVLVNGNWVAIQRKTAKAPKAPKADGLPKANEVAAAVLALADAVRKQSGKSGGVSFALVSGSSRIFVRVSEAKGEAPKAKAKTTKAKRG